MVVRKSVGEIEDNLIDGGARLLSEFESLADLGVTSPKQVVCIHFKSKDRYGFYMQSGKKLKSFSVPTAFIDKGRVLNEQVLKHIKESGLYFVEEGDSKLKVPTLARSVSSVLKNFQGSQYPVVSSYVRYFSSVFTEEQRRLLSRWFLQNGFYEEGLKRIELNLNTDTDYFRAKAAKLATLMGGGTWYFKELNYYETGGKCTLGHDIKWEFVAEEEATGEKLSFGVDCVQDFFNVEGQVQNQLVRFRTRYFNEMLTYSYAYSQQLGYQQNLGIGLPVLWNVLVEKGFLKPTPKLEYLLKFVNEFNALKLPLPNSLRIHFLKEMEEQRAYRLRYNFMDNTFGAVSLYNMYILLGELVPSVEGDLAENGAWSSIRTSIVSEHGLLLTDKELILKFLEHGFFASVKEFASTKDAYKDLVFETLANSTTEFDFQSTYNKLVWFSDIQNNRTGKEIPRIVGGVMYTKYSSPQYFGYGSQSFPSKDGKLEISAEKLDKYYEGILSLGVKLEDIMSVYKLFVKKLEEQRSLQNK